MTAASSSRRKRLSGPDSDIDPWSVSVLEADADTAEELLETPLMRSMMDIGGIMLIELIGPYPGEHLARLKDAGIPFNSYLGNWEDRWRHGQQVLRFTDQGLAHFQQMQPYGNLVTYPKMLEYLDEHGPEAFEHHIRTHTRLITSLPWTNQAAHASLYRAMRLIREAPEDNQAPFDDNDLFHLESLDLTRFARRGV